MRTIVIIKCIGGYCIGYLFTFAWLQNKFVIQEGNCDKHADKKKGDHLILSTVWPMIIPIAAVDITKDYLGNLMNYLNEELE